jgi:hypothetical protein
VVFLQQPRKASGLRDGEFKHYFHAAITANAYVWRIILWEQTPQILTFVQNVVSVALLLSLLLLKLLGSLSLVHV